MSFLQPFILMALPLIALPVLIHLINQNRHKTIQWAATMFLMQAKRMSRGMARLRYILILLMRMLAIAGLLFALSRPMSSGWLGLTAGSQPETTIIVLDRSASMAEQGSSTGISKRETALQKLSSLITNTAQNSQLVLFDSVSQQPLVINSAADLLDLPETEGTATTADIPGLLERVVEYMSSNQTGRTDIWICSDLRQTDWNPSGGRWEAIREQVANREGVRFYLLTYPDVADENVSVSISGVHRRETANTAELVFDIKLNRTTSTDSPLQIPLNIVINGARSTLNVEMTGNELVRNGHTIAIDQKSKQGWGKVELPKDSNLSDNSFYFVYAEPALRKTIIVSDDKESAELIRLATSIPAERGLRSDAEIIPSTNIAAIPWNDAAMIVWQVPIPTGAVAKQLEEFVSTGRTLFFLPPETPDSSQIFSTSWKEWIQPAANESYRISRWRTDAGLLGNTLSGSPLPVGEIIANRYCELETDGATSLAQFPKNVPLLTRITSGQGAAYFCATLPNASDSNFASNGIVLYIMMQRALARGAASLGAARQLECRLDSEFKATNWKPLDEQSKEILISSRTIQPGLYQAEETLLAMNRPVSEDRTATVENTELERLLNGLDYTIIDDAAGSSMQLASEVWRIFLIIMICALLLEAVLCIPEKQPQTRMPVSLEST